jgi:hypothetical protein
MKALILVLIGLLALVAVPVSADVVNVTNVTVPVILSFTGGNMFGDNPVQIIDNSTGHIAFMGNTSSRNIQIEPDRGYVLRVEPAGLTDAANSPDNALIGMIEYTGKNPIGSVAIALIIGVFISSIRRKVK